MRILVKVIKRDGSYVDFCSDKIYKAILKAMPSGSGVDKKIALEVAEEIKSECCNEEEVDISEIESMVYDKLIDKGHRLTAKSYEGYRRIREFQRENKNTTDEQIIRLVEDSDEYLKDENANKNPVLNPTKRDYIAGSVSSDATKRYLLSPDIVQAHTDGLIHFHDSDYFIQHMLTTPFDMIANQIIEENRGKHKHGSCGMGIYETIRRYKAGVTDSDYGIRDYYLDRLTDRGIAISDEWMKIILDDRIFEHWLEDFNFMCEKSEIESNDEFLKKFDNIVFEAGQGLLLDQNNKEYFPHLTPSNTGIKNAKKIIERIDWGDEINIETCYVSRTYLTRHGAGDFLTECDKEAINANMCDKTNVPNQFQDTLRYGLLILHELYCRCAKDVGEFGNVKSLALTHCNEYKWDNDLLTKLFRGWRIYYSGGENIEQVDGNWTAMKL